MIGRGWRIGAALLLLAGTPARAQVTPDVIRSLVRQQRIGQSFQALSIFSATPGIGAANYDADGFRINTYQLPISHRFEPFDAGWLGRVAVHAELTAGYLEAGGNDLFIVSTGGLPSSARTDFRVFTGLAGAGLDFLVTDDVTIRPVLLGGYSRIESDTRFSGPGAAQVEVATGNLLRRVRIDDALIGGALEAVYRHSFAGDHRVSASLRYNQFVSSNYSASDRAFRGDGHFGVGTARVGVNGPTTWQLLGREVRWLGFAGGTLLTGQQRALDFDAFAEIGGGIELVERGLIRGVEGLVLRGSVLLGNGISGWSAGLSLAF